MARPPARVLDLCAAKGFMVEQVGRSGTRVAGTHDEGYRLFVRGKLISGTEMPVAVFAQLRGEA